ncbi:MAG: BolA family protein [Panacagrimonas sp.]
MTRIERICETLHAAFPDARIELEDESHLHAGHAGAQSGRGHFRVAIAAAAFKGLAPIARHRAVYAALGELMQTDIHALSIDAREP